MSERGDWRQAHEDYVRRGTAWISVRQFNFIDIVPESEFGIAGKPTRTIYDVTLGDFVETVGLIRQLYVPNYDDGEVDDLHLVKEWVDENKSTFDKNIYGDEDFGRIPLAAILNYQTFMFPIHITDPSHDPKVQKIPVAFKAGSGDWRSDVHGLTLDYYDKLKYGTDYELGKKSDPNSLSSTRALRVIKEMYWGCCNDLERYEAIDTLTWAYDL